MQPTRSSFHTICSDHTFPRRSSSHILPTTPSNQLHDPFLFLKVRSKSGTPKQQWQCPEQRDSDWVNGSLHSAPLRNLLRQVSVHQEPLLTCPRVHHLGQGHLVPSSACIHSKILTVMSYKICLFSKILLLSVCPVPKR